MSELMDQAVIGMPYEMAMESELSRRQFYSRAQSILAQTQALREELSRINSLANCGSVQNWLKLSDEDKAKWFALYCQHDDENVAMRREMEALRARVVVVPGRIPSNGPKEEWYLTGWNACLDELARLNGKAVSEGLLHETIRSVDDIFWAIHAKPSCQSGVVARCRCRLCAGTRLAMARNDLNALLGEGKEVGDGCR